MKRGIKSDVAKTTKKIAGRAARQIAQEPFEILKQAGRQARGREKISGTQTKPAEEEKKTEASRQLEAKIKAQGKRQIQALEAEIEDIRKRKKLEEDERLREEELEESKKERPKPAPVVSSKPSRKVLKGIKGKLQRLKRKAEIRMPPTG